MVSLKLIEGKQYFLNKSIKNNELRNFAYPRRCNTPALIPYSSYKHTNSYINENLNLKSAMVALLLVTVIATLVYSYLRSIQIITATLIIIQVNQFLPIFSDKVIFDLQKPD